MYTRVSKIFLTLAVALYASLVVFNNLADYHANYLFVEHVLRMDTTFPGNGAKWRAIHSPFLQNMFFWLIILAEAAVAVLCWLGGFYMSKRINNPVRFNRAKGPAIAGLTLGILLWFSGFITIGGEWFLMWQSRVWNAQEAAFRLVVILGIALMFLVQDDP